MLPRTRSIFHLEEDRERKLNAIINGVATSEGRKSLVGLRIVIQQHQGLGSNVVIKAAAAAAKPWKSQEEAAGYQFMPSSFLKSCLMCKKELSPQKEVYMYRGDQGFCSVECRYKQILLDEKRELVDSRRRGRSFAVPSINYRSKVQASGRRAKASVAA